MFVTGEIITLQKSFCYLILNGNQVTIQKRAELHILSRYTHFQRTLLSECKVNHLFCYHQRNRQKLNVFIGFCYLFFDYYMSFSYQVHFGNGFHFLTTASLSALRPHGRLLRRWAVLLLPYHTLGTSRREWYGNGVTRRQYANFSRCHSFWTASMTAVCRGDKGGQWKSNQANNILYFSHRSKYDGRDTESCLQLGNPRHQYVGMVSNMVCQIIPMYQCLLVIAVPAFFCSSSYLFLIPQSFTRTLYYYCFSLPIHFAIVLSLPLRLFLQSCYSKFLQFPHC